MHLHHVFNAEKMFYFSVSVLMSKYDIFYEERFLPNRSLGNNFAVSLTALELMNEK